MSTRAAVPRGPIEVPDAVRRPLAHPRPVWRNEEEGGLTFSDARRGLFAKWNPTGTTSWLAAEPRTAARALGEGLRALHENLPADACPFDRTAETRLARWAAAVRAELGEAPPVDTLLGADGCWVAHVDLGALGVAAEFFAAYGVRPDAEPIRFSRALRNAPPAPPAADAGPGRTSGGPVP